MRDSAPLAAESLPGPIADALSQLIQRVRTVIIIRGLAAVIAAALGSLLAIMAIDAAVRIDTQWPRYMLTLTALAITAGAAVWFLILPLGRTITLEGIARVIETRHPELQERLSSAVELLASSDMPSIRGSEALIRALVHEANDDARQVRPRTEISLASAKPFLTAAGGVVLVFLAIMAVNPGMAKRLVLRAVAPYANIPNIYSDMLTVKPGNTIIPEGRRLEVIVDVDSRYVKLASFRKTLPDGSEVSDAMIAMPTDTGAHFSLTLPPATTGFKYRISAGDALTQYYTVTVVPPPMVDRLELRYDFPPYLAQAPKTDSPSKGDISAVAGTVVTITALTNKPVNPPDLRINGQSLQKPPLRAGTGDGRTWQFQLPLTAGLRGRWSMGLKDEMDFTSTTPDRTIETLADKGPVVKLLNTEKKIRLKPTDALPLSYEMNDDFGLASAEVYVETDSRKTERLAIALPESKGGPVRDAAGVFPMTLSSLQLAGVKELTLVIRAIDNLPADLKGPQVGQSDQIVVEIDAGAESYILQRMEAEEEDIRLALELILAELKATKVDSVPLKDNVGKVQALNDQLLAEIGRMREHLGVANAATGKLLTTVPQGFFTHLMPKLQTLGTEVDGANTSTGDVKLADAPSARTTAAVAADTHVDRAIALVLELMEDLKQLAAARENAEKLAELAQQAEHVAEQAAAEALAGQPPSPDLQAQQQQLAQDIAQAAQQDPAAQQTALEQAAQQAQQLAQQAEANRQQELSAVAGDNQATRVKTEQLAIAKEAAQLAQDAAKAGDAFTQATGAVAAAAKSSADQLATSVPSAAKSASDAAKQLASLVKDLETAAAQAQVAGQPAAPLAILAQKARDLATRQQALTPQIQALADAKPQQAAAAEQAAISSEKAQMAQQAAQMAQQAQQAAPQSPQAQQAAQQAQQAEKNLNDASHEAQEAKQAHEANSHESAAAHEQAAADALAKAAQAMKSAAQSAHAAAQAAAGAPAQPPNVSQTTPPGTPMPPLMPTPLGMAFPPGMEAAQTGSLDASIMTADLTQAASHIAMGAPGASDPFPADLGTAPGLGKGYTANPLIGIGATKISDAAAKLSAMGIRASDWAKLPGELRSQILQAADDTGPEEYRALIKRYFQQVAKQGGDQTGSGATQPASNKAAAPAGKAAVPPAPASKTNAKTSGSSK